MPGSFDTSVLIAGGGPVGLSLALELAWRGIGSILVEQGDGIVRHPKVGHVSVRTMEHVRRWGLARQVRNCGFPPEFALRMVYCTSMNGYHLCSHEYPGMRDARTPPVTPEKKQRCPQLWFDPILADAVRRHRETEVRYHTRLSGFIQDADGVTARIVDAEGERSVRVRYLAACDGANSEIRQTLGIAMLGNPVLSRSVAIYLRIPDMLAKTNQGEGERYTFIGADGCWGNLTVVDGRELWRLTVFGSQAVVDLERFDAAGWVRRCLANDAMAFEILSVLPWRRSQLVAERYRLGRVFLAGDAAHTMSPTGGFGMNTGIGDAVDLGWKLSGTLTGWGGPGLLESYDAERRPIGIRNVNFSAVNYHNLVSASDCSAILEPTAEGAIVRSRVGTRMKAATISEYESLGVILGYRYEDSPICAGDGSVPPADRPDVYVPNARAGARAPHVWLAPDRSILDLFGRGFVLLRFRGESADSLAAAARERTMPLAIVDVDNAEASALYGRALVLVRPDGHVAWRGDRLPEDCASLVDRVRGASAPGSCNASEASRCD